jgi:hypothetical protein
MFVVLLMSVSVWVAFVRWASGSRATGDDAVPEVVAERPNQPNQPAQPDHSNHANQQPDAAPVAASENGVPAADFDVRSAVPDTAVPDTAPPASSPKLSDNRAHDASRPKQPPITDRTQWVSAGNYTVRSGEHFAEIRVHRSSLLPSDTEFMWWTEAASAKPGLDYVHQGKVIQSFPKGKNSTSFFIKLVPGASRARREVFYVAIAKAGRNSSADPVARAAVWLPMNQDHSRPAAEHDAATVDAAAAAASAAAVPDAHPGSDTHADSRFSTAALGSPLQGSK